MASATPKPAETAGRDRNANPEFQGAVSVVSHHGSKHPATTKLKKPQHELKGSAGDTGKKKVTLRSNKKTKEKSLPATNSSTADDTRLSKLEEILSRVVEALPQTQSPTTAPAQKQAAGASTSAQAESL